MTGHAPIRLLIYESYAFQKVTGELRTVLYLLKHLDRGTFEPTVILPFWTDALKEERDRGTDVSVVEPPPGLRSYGGAVLRQGLTGRLRAVRGALQYWRNLYQLLRAKRVDVIYCCSLRALLMIGPAARVAGIPTLFFVNGALSNPILDTLAYLLAARVVFQCGANRDDRYPWLRRLFARKLAVVASGLDLALIERLRQAAPPAATVGVDAAKFNVIILGLLNPLKGTHLLIEAVARLGERARHMQLWVVGDQLTSDFSDYRSRLEAQARALGVQDVVRFTGWRTDALQLLAAMDVLVHPSLTEGMPRAVLEAMAMGKAVVATRVGCSREVIRHRQNGILIEPGSVEELTTALGELAADRPFRETLGRAAAATIASEHAIADKIRQFEQLFADLAGRRHQAQPVGVVN